jgi:hypothetical protein
LLVRLRFDESTGAVAADSSGNGWNATLVNTPTWTPGPFGNALSLASASSQHATLSAGVVSGVNDFTISAWVKIASFSTYSRIFDFGTGTTNYLFLTPQYTGTAPNAAKLRFAIRTPSVGEQQLTSSTALAAGTWAHVAITLTGSTGRMYLNGALVATNAAMTLKPASLGVTTLNYLGRSQFADPYLNGSLDDFRIYSRALSAAEISAQITPALDSPAGLSAIPGDQTITLRWASADGAVTYTVKRATTSGGPYTPVPAGSGLSAVTFTDTGLTNGTPYYYVVSASNALGESIHSPEAVATPSTLRVHLRFDEITGATAVDSSGRHQDATLVNAPTWSAGKINNAVTLTQTASHSVTLPAGVLGLTDTTIMTWVKLNTVTTWQRIFDFGTGTTNYMFLTTQYGTGGSANKLRFAIRTPGVAETVVNQINSSIAMPLGTWVHVAVVLSGTTGRLYLNGVEVGASTAMTLSPASLGVTTLNYLGKSQFAADPYLNAALDDFRIYSEALSASQIALFAAPLASPANLSATPGPLALDLAWSAVPSADRYTLRYAIASGGPYTTLSAGLPALVKLHSDLSYGTTYYYVVSAGNAAYDGPDSAELAAMPASALLSEAEVRPPLLALSAATFSAMLTSAPSVAGHGYQLQTTTDLAAGAWLNVGEARAGTGVPLVFETPYDSAEPRRFYRVLVTR